MCLPVTMLNQAYQARPSTQTEQSDSDVGTHLNIFVKTFVCVFESYCLEYLERLKKKIAKSGKWANCLTEFVDLGMGGNEAINNSTSKAVSVVLFNILKKVTSIGGAKYNREKLKKLTPKLYEYRNSPTEVRKMLVEASIDVFRCFEYQFMQVESCGCPQRAVELLAESAVHRALNFYKEKPSEDFASFTITKGVVLGSSKRGTCTSTNIPTLNKGHDLKQKGSNSKWNTNELFERTGLIIVLEKSDILEGTSLRDVIVERVDIFYKKIDASDKYGYRYLFNWENEDKVIKNDKLTFKTDIRKYVKLKPCYTYQYNLTEEICKQKVQTILDELDESAPKTEQLKAIKEAVNQEVAVLLEYVKDNSVEINKYFSELKEEWCKIKLTCDENLEISKETNELTKNHIKTTEEIRDIVKEISKRDNNTVKCTKGIWCGVRHLVSNFTGRKMELSDLHNKIQRKSETVTIITQMTVVSGLGGIGKTELAKKYIYEYSKDYDDNIVWIDAANKLTLWKSFQIAADQLKIKIEYEKDSTLKDGTLKDETIKKIVKDVYLEYRNEKSLFVFDNAESNDEFKSFLPLNCLGSNVQKPHILITSRDQEWYLDDIEVLNLKVLLLKDAMDLVKKGLKIQNKNEDNNVRDLVIELQCFPLALQQAIAYIRRSKGRIGIKEYLEKYKKEKKPLLDFEKFTRIDIEYVETTYTTWKITIKKIAQVKTYGMVAVNILHVIAYCASNNIDTKFFLSLTGGEEEILQEAVDLLVKYSMIDSENACTMISTHRLVQEVIKIDLNLNRKGEQILNTAMQIIILYSIRKNFLVFYKLHFKSICSHASQYKTLVEKYFSGTVPNYSFSILHALTEDGDIDVIINIFSHLKQEHVCELIYNKKMYSDQYYVESEIFPPHTLLDAAAREGQLEVVKHFVENYPDVTAQKTGKRTSLHWAANYGNLSVVKYLVRKINDDLNNAADHHIETLLHYAVKRGDIGFVKLMAEEHSDFTPECEKYEDILHTAAKQQGNLDIVEYLIKQKNFNPNAEDSYNKSPLYYAAGSGDLCLVEFLAAYDINFTPENVKYNDILHNAAKYRNNLQIVKYLIEHKNFDLNAVDSYNKTPLHYVVEKSCCLRTMKYLVENERSDFTPENDKYKDILHKAVERGSSDIVKYLIEQKNVSPNALDSCNRSPLYYTTTTYCDLDVLENLVGNDLFAYLSRECDEFIGLFQEKHQQERSDIARYLVQHENFDPNAVDGYNRTPLHYATETGDLHLVECVVNNKKSDFTPKSPKYKNLLHLAAQRGYLDIVRYLILEKRIEHNILDDGGKIPVDYAQQHPDVINYLESRNQNTLTKL